MGVRHLSRFVTCRSIGDLGSVVMGPAEFWVREEEAEAARALLDNLEGH